MTEFLSIVKSFTLLILLVLMAGFSAGIAWGVLGRVFRFGLGLVS